VAILVSGLVEPGAAGARAGLDAYAAKLRTIAVMILSLQCTKRRGAPARVPAAGRRRAVPNRRRAGFRRCRAPSKERALPANGAAIEAAFAGAARSYSGTTIAPEPRPP